VFVTGMQISLGVGLLVAMVLLVVVARKFPDTTDTATPTTASAVSSTDDAR
jgi:flagellar biosynthesis protein FliR